MREGVVVPTARSSRSASGSFTGIAREALAGLMLALGDYAVAGACLVAGELIVPGQSYFAATWGLAVVWPFMLWREGLYPAYGVHRADKLRGYVGGVVSGLIIVAVFRPFLFPGDDVLLPSLAVATMIMFPTMYVVRVVSQRILRAVGVWGRSVVVLGAGEIGQRVVEGLVAQPLMGLNPVAVFDNDENKVGSKLLGIPVVGPLRDAETYAARLGIGHAVLAIAYPDPNIVTSLTGGSESPFRRLQIVPDLPGLPVATVQASNLNDLLALEVRNNLKIPRNRAMKRTFDLALATIGTLLVSPLLLAIGLLIRLDSQGPVFYRQERIGMGGRYFRVWKFRTMVVGADARLGRQLEADPELCREWEASHKLAHDPRVTRVGSFLRRTSLDELPQLINVFLGEMSLVGPRPIVDAEVPRYGNQFDLYTLVRPGMTGYWQISGRSDTSYDRRVELDGFYTRNWSIWFDFVILFATLRVVLSRDGAY